MKFKNIFLSCLLMAACASVSAQRPEGPAPEIETETEYVFKPHWYLQVQPVGAQYTLGETDFSTLVSYNVQLGIGYQFNSMVGLRLSANAWQSRAGIDNGTEHKWKWNYVSPMLDVTFNVSELFCNYNPKRVFNFSVFAGLGANIAWGNDEAYAQKAALGDPYLLSYYWDGTKVRMTGRLGFQADFRLCDAVSLGLEFSANALNDKYNSKKAQNWDWYFNGLIGLKINLGKTYKTKTKTVTPPPPAPERVIERVVEKPAPPAPAPEPKKEDLRENVYFTISVSQIMGEEKDKVKNIADYLKKYPEATVQVTGYADKGTGNADLNMRLAEKRAQAVVDMLVNEYGISSSRIFSSAKGDTEQPFTVPEQNRVTICIAK